ncbi:aldolase [Serendipita vermifera]|nr:aldolase [Serendipita vermifera]
MTLYNGSSKPSRPLTAGIYAPIPTFFVPESEDLDIPTFQKHIVYIATAGIGILICGSMGEAHHLSPTERVQLIKAAREALDKAHFTTTPIVVGTGTGSTRETIKLTKEAAEAGADYSIVIPSGYFAGALANDRKALKTFFKDVAEASPIPVMVYNYPGASGGIDMDSDLIEEMAKDIPNLCGVKLTCGNVGKLTRIAATVSVPSFAQNYPRKNKDAPFLVLGGFIDFLLPSVYANAHGAITGLANLYPRTIRALWDISLSTLPTASTACTPELLSQAQQLQGIVARADRTVAVTGIAGTKWILTRRLGYGGVCRKPLSAMVDADGEKLRRHPHVVDIEEMEALLEAEAKGTVANKTAIKKLVHGGISSYLTNGHTSSNGIPVHASA